MRRGAGQNYHMNLVQSAGIQSTHWFCVCAIDHVLTGRNTFLSTFDESPAVPKKGKCKQFASCNKVDPLWRWELHTTNILNKAPTRTNRPNQGKFESWVSGHSATDHPCALHHQTCFWMALFWPPPRTAGVFFYPHLNFPGFILPYFFRADPPVAVCLLGFMFLIRALQGGQIPPHRLFWRLLKCSLRANIPL